MGRPRQPKNPAAHACRLAPGNRKVRRTPNLPSPLLPLTLHYRRRYSPLFSLPNELRTIQTWLELWYEPNPKLPPVRGVILGRPLPSDRQPRPELRRNSFSSSAAERPKDAAI